MGRNIIEIGEAKGERSSSALTASEKCLISNPKTQFEQQQLKLDLRRWRTLEQSVLEHVGKCN